jgi:hypothetical protein
VKIGRSFAARKEIVLGSFDYERRDDDDAARQEEAESGTNILYFFVDQTEA